MFVTLIKIINNINNFCNLIIKFLGKNSLNSFYRNINPNASDSIMKMKIFMCSILIIAIFLILLHFLFISNHKRSPRILILSRGLQFYKCKIISSFIYAMHNISDSIGPLINNEYVLIYIITSAVIFLSVVDPSKKVQEIIALRIYTKTSNDYYASLILVPLFILSIFVEYSILRLYSQSLIKEYPQIKDFQIKEYNDKVLSSFTSSLIDHIEILAFLLSELYTVKSFSQATLNLENNIMIVCIIMPLSFIIFIMRGKVHERIFINKIMQ